MQTMKTGRTVVNPFNSNEKDVATASAGIELNDNEVATASALTNMRADQCPKCGDCMGKAYIATGAGVFYCNPCRVTNPTPD